MPQLWLFLRWRTQTVILPGFTHSTVGSMMAGGIGGRRHSGVLHELMQSVAELLPKCDGRSAYLPSRATIPTAGFGRHTDSATMETSSTPRNETKAAIARWTPLSHFVSGLGCVRVVKPTSRKTIPGSSAPQAKSSMRDRTNLALPTFRPVQLATLVDTVPAGDRWIHERKYDGYRILVAVGGGEASAYTRSGLDWSQRFPSILSDARKLQVRSALIDGEAVVVDADGRSNFQALQNALKGAPATIDFYAFDLLQLDGEDLTRRPLLERKEKLAAILPSDNPVLRYSDHILGRGEELLDRFCAAGLEGVVSKLADSTYVGARGGSWLKIKCIKRQEFVIVGWTPSDKVRAFRSLILGVHDGGKLRYAGKVGTGFDTAELFRLMKIMAPLEQKAASVEAPRAEVRGAHWLRPKLVAEIAFTEMTNEGTLRHPSYLGLREDKNPEAVVLETERRTANLTTSPAHTIAISNRDRVIYPESNINQGPARGPLRGRRGDHAALGWQSADQSGSVPAGPCQEVLFPEA